MSDRREERERLRQERLASQGKQGSSERTRLILGYAVAGVLAVAVLAGLVFVIASGGDDDGGTADTPGEAHIDELVGVFEGYEPDTREGTVPPEIQFGDLEESAREAGCDLRLELPNEGRDHFADENEGTYATNPPTSGDHYSGGAEAGSGAVADGAYVTAPPEPRLVHAMEHGRVIIRYVPDLPEDQQLALKGVFDEEPGGMIMVPDPDLKDGGYVVAVSAWQNLAGCAKYDPLVLDVVRNFRDTFRGNGPENVAMSG